MSSSPGTQPNSSRLPEDKKNELQELLDRVKVDLKDILFCVFLFVWLGGYFWMYIYIYLGFVCGFLGSQKKAWENYQRKPWQNDGTDHFPFKMIPQKRGEVLNFRGVKLLVEQLQSC